MRQPVVSLFVARGYFGQVEIAGVDGMIDRRCEYSYGTCSRFCLCRRSGTFLPTTLCFMWVCQARGRRRVALLFEFNAVYEQSRLMLLLPLLQGILPLPTSLFFAVWTQRPRACDWSVHRSLLIGCLLAIHSPRLSLFFPTFLLSSYCWFCVRGAGDDLCAGGAQRAKGRMGVPGSFLPTASDRRSERRILLINMPQSCFPFT